MLSRLYCVGVPKNTLSENHTSVPGKEIENVEQETTTKHMMFHVFSAVFCSTFSISFPGTFVWISNRVLFGTLTRYILGNICQHASASSVPACPNEWVQVSCETNWLSAKFVFRLLRQFQRDDNKKLKIPQIRSNNIF